MIKIRRGVFETNSSSTHTIAIMNDSDYENWVYHDWPYDVRNEKVIPPDTIEQGRDGYIYYSFDRFNDYTEGEPWYNNAEKELTTESGIYHIFSIEYGSDCY